MGRGQDRRSGYVIDFDEAVLLGLVASWTNLRRNWRSTALVLVRFALEMEVLEVCRNSSARLVELSRLTLTGGTINGRVPLYAALFVPPRCLSLFETAYSPCPFGDILFLFFLSFPQKTAGVSGLDVEDDVLATSGERSGWKSSQSSRTSSCSTG